MQQALSNALRSIRTTLVEAMTGQRLRSTAQHGSQARARSVGRPGPSAGAPGPGPSL